MTEKTNVANAQSANATKGKNAVESATAKIKNAQEELQKRLQSYGLLQQKVNQRSVLQVHKDSLVDLQVTTNSPHPFDDSKKGLDSIELHTENGKYEIKNPTLLERVRLFLISEITTRTNELETEILEAQI